ncbi:MAG TPA: PAS domain S-box protein [Gammaproteobacteria bacterium]|nr:PAS domain S-box protein [Gammaproteobacteria bacterium]
MVTPPKQPQTPDFDLPAQVAIMDALIEAIVITNDRGKIERCNKAAVGMFGYSQEEAMGQDISILMPPNEEAKHSNYVERYRRTRKARIIGIGRELNARRKDGTIFPIHLALSEITYNGTVRFIGLIRDLTDDKKAEERTLRLHTDMITASRLTTMGEMAAAMAHEINQPLAAIANYASASERILASRPDDIEDIKTALHHIKTQSHRAGDIIRKLRSFVTPGSVDLEPTDIKAIIDEIKPLAEVDANANNIAIYFDVSTNLPKIVADQMQIQQVLLNLLRNGIDAMHDCNPEHRRLELHCYIATPHNIRIDVIDHGHGITEEAGKNMFLPFFTTKTSGMGMGLAISHSIVKSHSGVLSFSNNLSGGATFSVMLPTKMAN